MQVRARSDTTLHERMAGTYNSQSYYGGDSNFMLRDISDYDDLQNIVELSARALPNRPDGIVCVIKYTSSLREDCRATEAEYERLARSNPATVFLRCFEEFENSHILLNKADLQVIPTYDVFYGGNRVSRIEGIQTAKVQETLDMYQFMNSDLDLFSEDAVAKRKMQLGDGQRSDAMATPRTTGRFIPGYDWNKEKGFFDEQASKIQESFEDQYENSWLPMIDDDDDDDDDDDNPKNKK